MGRTWVWSMAETHFTGAEQAWAASCTPGSLSVLICEMRLTLPELGVYNTEECIGGDAMNIWIIKSQEATGWQFELKSFF